MSAYSSPSPFLSLFSPLPPSLACLLYFSLPLLLYSLFAGQALHDMAPEMNVVDYSSTRAACLNVIRRHELVLRSQRTDGKYALPKFDVMLTTYKQMDGGTDEFMTRYLQLFNWNVVVVDQELPAQTKKGQTGGKVGRRVILPTPMPHLFDRRRMCRIANQPTLNRPACSIALYASHLPPCCGAGQVTRALDMVQTAPADCLRVFVVRHNPGMAVTLPEVDMEHERAYFQQERTAELLQLLRTYLGLDEGKAGDASFRDHFSTRGKATDTLRRCRPGPDFVVDKPEDEDVRSAVDSEETNGISRIDQSVDEMGDDDITALAGAPEPEPEPEPEVVEDADAVLEEEPDLGSFFAFANGLVGNIEHDAAPLGQDEAQPSRVTKRPRRVLPSNMFGVTETPVDDGEREACQEPGRGYVCKKNIPTLDLAAFKTPTPKKPRLTTTPPAVMSPLRGEGEPRQNPAIVVKLVKLDANREPKAEPAAEANAEVEAASLSAAGGINM